ncbi:MAG TPA: hypothetical protein VFO11_10255 [Candidatus Polarisedimenticolaceae bacterium]|nr:hypothetical protein [Candidatus Polarisedimenticolaceae bacterium]
MDPILLGSRPGALTIEADWVAGCPPHPATVPALAALARKVRGGDVRVLAGNEISREEWQRLAPESLRSLVEAHATVVDGIGSHVYVMFVPRLQLDGRAFGTARSFMLEGRRTVRVVFVDADTVRQPRVPGLPDSEIERATVLHEFGHLLGLVGDRSHAQKGDPQHCSGARCVMPGPTRKMMAAGAFRAVFQGRLPEDYCDACWSDIRRARVFYGRPESAGDLGERATWHDALLSGSFHAARGKREDAATAYQASLVHSVSAQEVEDVARAALGHGFAETAWQACRSAQERGLRSPILDHTCGRAALDSGHLEDAVKGTDVLVRVAALEDMGRFDLAARAAEGGDAPIHRVAQATALRRGGHPLQAMDVLRSSPARTFAEPELLLEKARCFRSLGRDGDYRATLRAAAEEGMHRARRSSSTWARGSAWRTAAVAAALNEDRETATAALTHLRQEAWPEIYLTTRAQVEAIGGDDAASERTLDVMRREGFRPLVDPSRDEDWAARRPHAGAPFARPGGRS